MPEPYWPKRKGTYRITDAMKHHEVATIHCHYCKTRKFYLLKDLKVLFGDVEMDDIIFIQRWRCVKCGRDDTLHLDISNPSAADRQSMVLRRIERIEYVRKVTWRDERG